MSKIILYHGSKFKFNEPCIQKAKNFRDFGKGFYLTENYLDALSILKFGNGYVYEFEFLFEDLNKKEFDNDDLWLDYVVKNRTNIPLDNSVSEYDFVVGKTACGNCSKIFKKIRNGSMEINKEELKRKILNGNYDKQYCLKTQKAISSLRLLNIGEYTKEDFA